MKSILEFLVKQHIKSDKTDKLLGDITVDQIKDLKNNPINYKGIRISVNSSTIGVDYDSIITDDNLDRVRVLFDILNDILNNVKKPIFDHIMLDYNERSGLIARLYSNTNSDSTIIHEPTHNKFMITFMFKRGISWYISQDNMKKIYKKLSY